MPLASAIFVAARLSNDEVVRAIRENWNSGPHAVWLLIGFALTLAALMTVLYIRKRRELEPSDAAPAALFHDLALSLGISLRDRRMLARISRQQSLPSPLALLLSPRTMRHHASAYCTGLTRRRRSSVLHRVRATRGLLRGP
jgi:hypothetical protein